MAMGQAAGTAASRSLRAVAVLLALSPTLCIELNNEETLRKAVKKSPRDPKTRMKLVNWHLKWGELRKAIDELLAAVQKDPANAWQYRESLGDVYLTRARDERAAASHYKEALALNPAARRSLLQYGTLRIWQGHRNEVEPLFKKAVDAKLLADTRQRPLERTRPAGSPPPRPWHDAAAASTGAQAAATKLAGAAQVIQAEYLKWAKTRAKDSEADGEGAADPHAPGRWRHFWVLRPRYERGVWRAACSYKAPKTCELLRSLNNTGRPGEKLVILRADFDVLEPRGRIRPHCHPTDTETLLVMPLLTPRLGPNATTSLAVGGEARPWAEGRVFLFDATFEHEESVPAPPEAGEAGHDYAGELRAFYGARGLAGKAPGIPEILAKWAGMEEKMMREVSRKYLPGWKGERVMLRLLVRRSALNPGSSEGQGRGEL